MGRCESFVVRAPRMSPDPESIARSSSPGATPWLTPVAGGMDTPTERFKAYFFRHHVTGDLYCRIVPKLWGECAWRVGSRALLEHAGEWAVGH